MSSVQYEVYSETTNHLAIEVRDGHVEVFDNAVEHGTAVRVIRDEKVGFAYSTEANVSEEMLIKRARETSSAVARDSDALLPSRDKNNIVPLQSNIQQVSLKEKIDLALRLEMAARGCDKKITNVRGPGYKEYIKDVRVVNSNGVEVEFSHGLSYIGLGAVAEHNGVSDLAYEEEYALDPKDLDADKVANVAASRAISYLDGRKVQSMESPCILDNRMVAQILGVFSPLFFADTVFKHRSPFENKIGKEICSEAITIVNDPTLNGGFSSVPYDAEGVVTKRCVLVEKGRLLSFLSDCYFAKKVNGSVQGSSVRQSIMQMPRIGIHNLHILPGKSSQADMMSKMGKGLVVTELLGLHTANPVSGDFSVGAVGFWVEGGTKKHAVKGVTVAGNIHELLRRTTDVGSDLRFWHTYGAPSLLIESIAIAGT